MTKKIDIFGFLAIIDVIMVNKTTYKYNRILGRKISDQINRLTHSIAGQLEMLPEFRDLQLLNMLLSQLCLLRPQLRKVIRGSDAHISFDREVTQLTLRQRNELTRDIAMFNTLRLTERKFTAVIKAIKAQANFEPRPLYLPDPPAYTSQYQMTKALDSVFLALHQLANPTEQTAAAQELGCHRDIPLAPSVFVEDMLAAYRVWLAQKQNRPARFLDIGCGGGIKLLLAEQFFGRVEGLEYDVGYAAAAQGVQDSLALSNIQVLQGDGLKFEEYGEYDVLYFYQPMLEGAGLPELEERIASHARPGCILVAPYPRFLRRAKELGCAHIAKHIFSAGMCQADGDILRAKAEQMGIVPPRQPIKLKIASGLWDPITKVAYANGFRVF